MTMLRTFGVNGAPLATVMFVISVQACGFLLERSARPERLCHATIVAWCVTLLFIVISFCQGFSHEDQLPGRK